MILTRTEFFILADLWAASSLSKPMDVAALTIWRHSSGVKTSRTRKAPGTPGTLSFVGGRREVEGEREMAPGEEA